MQGGSTEEEEMKRQLRMKIVKDMVKKFDQKEEWKQIVVGGSVSCWRQTVRKHGFRKDWKTPCRNGTIGWEK